jgi:hypothetical protein
MTCRHEKFAGRVDITRLSEKSGGPVTGYTADVTIRCDQCGLPFRFVGIAAGNHYAEPRVSVDGQELRAPIEPAEGEKLAPWAGYVLPPAKRH